MYYKDNDISELDIRIVTSKKDRDLFLKLPSLLYTENEIMQDMDEEKKLLLGEHILSKYAKHIALISCSKDGAILARCMIAFYKDKDCAYLGFFECVKDEAVSEALLSKASALIKKSGKKSIKGPLNFSFWLGYRFKNSSYGSPFSLEPYNKPYYVDLWEKFGFKISDRYYSNMYKKVPKNYFGVKQRRRLEHFISRGYSVKHPDFFTFKRSLRDIYYAISELYRDFQGYSDISLEDFLKLYSKLQYIINSKMVFLIYKDEKLAGFTICLPDYGNLLTKPLNFNTILGILKRRFFPKSYIILYLGVYKEHLGLGTAMSELVKEGLSRYVAKSISALIHETKTTKYYYKELKEGELSYVFMELAL